MLENSSGMFGSRFAVYTSRPDPIGVFTPGRLSPEVPKRGKIFDFFVLTEPEYSHFSIDYHRV